MSNPELNTTEQENNSFLSYRWLVGILISIVFVVAGLIYRDAITRITDMEDTLKSDGNRITKLEAQSSSIDSRLSRMESKIDQLLDEKRKQP